MKFHPFPTLETERLELRQLQDADAPEILYFRSDPTITQYIQRPENRRTQTLADAQAFLRAINGYIKKDVSIMWAISYKGADKALGTICLWNFNKDQTIAELGYDLATDHQGKGIMSEAVKAVIAYGFDTLGLNKIEAFTHFENMASIHLLEANHFVINNKRQDHDNANNRIFERFKEN